MHERSADCWIRAINKKRKCVSIYIKQTKNIQNRVLPLFFGNHLDPLVFILITYYTIPYHADCKRKLSSSALHLSRV